MRFLTLFNSCLFGLVALCFWGTLTGCSDDEINKKDLTREEALPFFSEPLPES